ncbi:alcohol dehydrogenase catalytic domain-containing protein [Micromonospora sp. NBC_01699]|uniref:alcohol dehydrogenase catalytic domain-containing protein n=1 Tax=Micromonospora sp. NBC_01699 TaxID=2975984 RepID=UPI002E2D8695|nr:alcohol dehydrogenase catalytic domain-containing protein [Micromonospora sp. NBC_01699]
MQAAVVPKVNARWEIQEIPTPRPGPGDVLIRVHASGICVNDVLATRGVIPFPAVTPAVTGHEPVGEVVEVGAGVTSRAVGDRVGTTWVQATCGRCDYCRLNLPVSGQAAMNCVAPRTTGFSVAGGHAEYVVAAADATVLLPDGLAYELAAPMMCAGYTSWSALRQSEPKPHERIAVLGVGALGHLAVQFAHACGYETIAVTRSPDKHEVAKQLGADIVVSDGAELRDVGGADVILETCGSYQAASDSLRGLRVDGRLVLVGLDNAAGFNLAPERTKPFFTQRHRIMGATHGGLRYLTEALQLVARGRCTPVVETFTKDRIPDALDRVANGDVRFRAVVTW